MTYTITIKNLITNYEFPKQSVNDMTIGELKEYMVNVCKRNGLKITNCTEFSNSFEMLTRNDEIDEFQYKISVTSK